MATPKLLFAHLRRSRLRLLSSGPHFLSHPISDFDSFSPSSTPPPPQLHHSRRFHFSSTLHFPLSFFSRSFSSRPSDGDLFLTESDHLSVDLNQVADSGIGDSSILPVPALISMLDWYHDLTGLPWWIIIASSTVAMRLAVFPLLILQLNKLKRIGECFPKLPPILPPHLSGRSYIDQLSLFRKERLAMGCPSYLWFPAYFAVQVPCFFLWMSSIRKMSLNHHPGFDCGGALWFQNLTEFAHDVSGPIFPLLIAGLHFTNVQISFGMSSAGKVTGWLGLLAKYYRIYLNILALPLFFIGYCVPQGSLVYWVTNSSLTVIQQLALKHPAVRTKLGLAEKNTTTEPVNSDALGAQLMTFVDPAKQQRTAFTQKLSPKKLFVLSMKQLSKGDKETAISLLQLAIKKDPNYARPYIVLGQTLMQKGMLAEASEYLERAISKLCFFGQPTEVEDVDLLILASTWAGSTYIRQGKWAEGTVHLERIGNMKEPEEPLTKAHYFEGLLVLSSALDNQGRKEEALKYLRVAAAYDPAYKVFLEQCEKGDDFVTDLTTSRRGDY